MSVEILENAKTCFHNFQARLSHLYSNKGSHYAYISMTDKKIYLVNDPMDLLNSVTETDVLAQFFKKQLISFGQKYPQILPHFIFIAYHIFAQISKQVNNNDKELDKFRMNLRSEILALKTLISSSIKTTPPKFTQNECFEYIFQNLLKFSSPNIREMMHELFKELDKLTNGFSDHTLHLNNFLIDVCKQELDPYTIHRGICIEIEDLMMDDERISKSTLVILMDFTEGEPFGLEYNYEELTPEMHRVLKAYEQKKYSEIIQKLGSQGVELIISFGESPPQFDDILTSTKTLTNLKLKEVQDLYQISNLLKVPVYRFNEISWEATDFKSSPFLQDIEILRLTRRSFLRFSSNHGEFHHVVINCRTNQEKAEIKKYLELLLRTISNLKQNNWEIFEMERILKSVEAQNATEFECLKTYRLVFGSVSEIIFSQKLKDAKKQSWLDICDTKSSWNSLFEELLNTLQMTLKLDKIIKAQKLK